MPIVDLHYQDAFQNLFIVDETQIQVINGSIQQYVKDYKEHVAKYFNKEFNGINPNYEIEDDLLELLSVKGEAELLFGQVGLDLYASLLRGGAQQGHDARDLRDEVRVFDVQAASTREIFPFNLGGACPISDA